jgi:hypothetical protein
MSPSSFHHSPLAISSFEDLLKHEPEIVRRINDTPNGGRLLILDAARLLADLGVTLSEEALFEWRRRVGFSVGTPSRTRTAYDAIARGPRDERVRIRVRNLLPKEKL